MEKEITVNGRAFRILRLLGKGKGGYSYLVTDGANDYTVKQIHHEPCAYYNFGDKLQAELCDYGRLANVGIAMPKLLDVDVVAERILKEYIDGDTAFDLVRRDMMTDDVLRTVREMSDKLRAVGLNIDWFPTNFIIAHDGLYYIDYECNEYIDEWSFENWGIEYWSKSPEFIEYAKAHAE